jgi:ATP-dependent Lhr-like helicase
MDKPFPDAESLGSLNEYVRKWFTSTFVELTPPQKFTFKLAKEGKNMLITAPTGSGKTMSGFVGIISRLFDKALAGTLEDKTYCIYVSPLRALNNDIYRNLTLPLEQIYDTIKHEKGADVIKGNIKKVTIGVRTGDTKPQDRKKMIDKPPNILVTTPESLAILLNSEKFLERAKDIEFFVIDEVHELANNKRGVHLSLSIERLEDLVGHPFQRIGLGATLFPLEEAAKFVVGFKDEQPRDCTIVDASWSKKLDVVAISPVKDILNAEENEVESNMYKELNRIIESGKTTLIFTNTRSGTERVVFGLKSRLKMAEEDVAAHHGSLSRGVRFEVEELLKKGALKCVVSSTSLELGIDIGSIDNVVQLGSPKSVTRAIQRIGRAGHSYKAVAKGEMIVLNRDDLVECSVMLYAALTRHLDSFSVPKGPLDVLVQHIVGMSINKTWDIDEALRVVKNAYAYTELKKEDFLSLIHYLAGDYVGLESRRVYGKIWYEEKEGKFGKRGKMVKVIYMLNLGTIPDTVAVSVFNGKKRIGSIEEEFLEKLKPGDIFTLGGKLYSFQSASGMKCYVSTASTKTPTIPPWFSEQLPLSYELADAIGQFRKSLSEVLEEHNRKNKVKTIGAKIDIPKKAMEILSNMPIDANAVEAIYRYFQEQLLFAGIVPNNELLLIEQTFDKQSGRTYLVFHALYGRRINDALSRICAITMSDILNTDVGMLVTDNGFVLSTEKNVDMDGRTLNKIIDGITSKNVLRLLKENIRRTELMKRRFRHVAGRSFMILRNYMGWKSPVRNQQINAQLLLKAAEEIDPNFPVIAETYREIFNDLMDLPRARMILDRIKEGKIKYKFIRTPSPSPFSHMMIAFGHADVIMMKERQQQLKYLHSLVMERIKSNEPMTATE